MIIIASYSNVSVTYTADGTQTVFSFPFDYLRKAFVYIEVNEETILTQGIDYTVSGKTVVFPTAPASGTLLRIYRETDTTRLVSWADASVLKASDMTVQQVQELHILEEQEYWTKENTIVRNGHEWNARHFPIKNTGDPVDPKDATTKEYVDDELDTAIENLQLLADIVVDSEELQHITDQFNAIDENAEIASNAAETAVNSANSANTSKNSASASATSATNTANALINFLETKETITAPAIDPTLTVSGAGADAKVVGDKFPIVPRDTAIFELNGNLVNPATNIEGYYVNPNTGELNGNASISATDFIPVESNTTYGINVPTLTNGSNCWYAWYNNSKTYISGGTGNFATALNYLLTSPATAKFLRFSTYTAALPIIITKSNTKPPFVAYDDVHVLSKYIDLPSISPRDTNFFYISKNLVDPSKTIEGYLVNQANGILAPYANQTVTDYIPVKENTTYGLTKQSSPVIATDTRYAWYDEAHTYLAGGVFNPYVAQTYTITSPASAKFLRVALPTSHFPIMVAESTTQPIYEPYDNYYLLPEYIPQEPKIIEEPFNLPSTIYATVGYELNIYFENLVEDWTKYHWNVECAVGSQWARGYKLTPTEADVGTKNMTITIERDGASKTLSTSLVISSANAGSGETASMIILGDSTTANGIAVHKLHDNFDNDVMSVQTFGTVGTAPYNHEGRSGYSLARYFTENTPFYNPSTHTFDAAYYFANSGVTVPDWFIINLGVNDMFGYTTDTAMQTAINNTINYMDSAVASLKAAEPNMKIGICITIPPNHSQDAYAKDYFCGQTRDRYKRNNVYWVNRLIEEYDNRTDESIYLIPIYTNLDTIYNMGQGTGMETLPVNARNTDITYQSPTPNGGVHPGTSGYWQIADVYTAFLKGNV